MASESLFCPHCGAAYSLDEKQCAFCQHVFTEELDLLGPSDLFHERYHILRQIGTGGFGAVYQARDTQAQQRLVAIKQINLRGLTAQEIIEATDGFNRERQFLSSLTHDHLPKIYDHFMDAEHWYLIMEFIAGETLETYLQSLTNPSASFVRALSVDEIVDIGLQLCDVLSYLHGQRQPIIFRDLKPSNVMRTDLGVIYLIDFGIARYFKPGKLKDTIPFGSPGYAAPEQYGKGQTTAQADIYSLGALLYYMLSGLDPAENPFHFAPLRLYGTAGLAEFEELIMQMVALDVSQRPRSIDVVIIELQYIRRLRGSSEQRIWRSPSVQQPIGAAPAAGSSPYWPGSTGQSGQQQSQMSPPQAQSQGAGTSGIGRRLLIKRGWQIGLVVGVGSIFLHNAISSSQSSPGVDIGPPQVHFPMMTSVWDTDLPNGAATITSVVHSPIKGLFAVADQAGNIFVLSTTTYEVIYQWQVPQPVTSLSWTFDAQYLSIAAGRSVFIWEIPPVGDVTQPGEISKKPWAMYNNILSTTVQTVSWNLLDKMTLAVGDIDGNVRVFQISAKGILGHPLYELAGRSKVSQPLNNPPVVAVRWAGSLLYSLYGHDSVIVWDLHNSQRKGVAHTFLNMGENVQEILVNAIGITVLTSGSHIRIFNENYLDTMDLEYVNDTINTITYSNDGKYLLGASINDRIYIWYLGTPAATANFVSPRSMMQSIDYVENSTGNFVIAGGENGVLQIWKAE